jgi:RNA polymerase sigma-70 factor (ECF subfamily)
MPPDEAELVRRVVATRDPDAFGQLYEIYIDRIGRYIYYKVGDREEAEDLTEQVFLKAWENIQGFRGEPAAFPVWIFRLAHNLVIDHHRTQRQTAQLNEFIVDTRPQPEEEVAVRLDNEQLRQAISHLTPEQQRVVILRFIQGMSHAEVAAIMKKNEVAVRGIQYRALVALQRILKSTEDLAR